MRTTYLRRRAPDDQIRRENSILVHGRNHSRAIGLGAKIPKSQWHRFASPTKSQQNAAKENMRFDADYDRQLHRGK